MTLILIVVELSSVLGYMGFSLKMNKREKAEDFIGWKSEDGKLEVIGIEGKNKHRQPLFKVTCTECSKDKELFPDGYFVSRKPELIRGQKPCSCARNPRWKDWQYLILARRAAKDRFIVHGFSEEFKGVDTKLNLECLKDGHKWVASISNITSKGSACPKCSGNAKPTEQEALQKCIDICKEMNYEPIGFVNGYNGTNKTRFEYICKIHGKQNVRYSDFIYHGSRCGSCGIELIKYKQKTPEDIALQKCIDICKEMNYEPIGFVEGYINANETRFEYICKIHGKQNIKYNDFVNTGTRCGGCWKDKKKELGNRNGFYSERKDEQDFLYILDFNNQFIKVGRSFDIDNRINGLKFKSKVPKKKIKKLRIFSGTHEQIYNLEQEIHSELRERNFQYYQDWSTECFDKDCLFILNNILDSCELREVKI